MTKANEAIRAGVLADKGLTNKELQAKYGVSRSTIQRIRASELESRAAHFLAPGPASTPEPTVADEAVLSRLFAGIEEKPQVVQIPEMAPARDRSQLMSKILLNVDTFPALFPQFADRTKLMVDLGRYSVGELEGLLESVETTRATSNFSAQLKNVFFVVSRATETLGGLVRLKANGLTDALMQQQQELDYIFKEIAIEYSDSFKASSRPEVRLMMMFGMTLLQVDSTNRLRDRIKVKEDVQKKYQDL
jgi:hypothetical protein